jgi:hypothetical protein
MENIHVFISLITEEQETALRLKVFLKESLGWGLNIFVSSDYESIGGGHMVYEDRRRSESFSGRNSIVVPSFSPTAMDRF